MPPTRALGLFAAGLTALTTSLPAAAQTLDRIRQAERSSLGYIAEAPPFSFGSGAPEGYSIAICEEIADAIGAAVGAPDLARNWVPVTAANRFDQVEQGTVDLLCTPAGVLQQTVFGVVADTTTEAWIEGRLGTFRVDASVVTVPDYGAGLERLVEGEIDVFFGDLALVLGAFDAITEAFFMWNALIE